METFGAVLAVVTPLIAVPLTLITFYLRSLREHQLTTHAQLERRMEQCESGLQEWRRMLGGFERDFTTKEEWLRECMHARRQLEELSAAVIRIETTLRNGEWRMKNGE